MEITPEQKIQIENTEAEIKENKILSAIKDKNLGTGLQNTELGKVRGYQIKSRENLVTTARYDKFREEFKDIFTEINEKKYGNL